MENNNTKLSQPFQKPLGIHAARWLGDLSAMYREIHECISEAEALFDRDYDESFNQVWAIPQSAGTAWRRRMVGIALGLERASMELQLFKTVHPLLPFDPMLLTKFSETLWKSEADFDIALVIRQSEQLTVPMRLLVGWITMSVRLKPQPDATVDDNFSAKKRSATPDDMLSAVARCRTRGKVTDETVRSVLRDEMSLSCANSKFQRMKTQLKREGQWQ